MTTTSFRPLKFGVTRVTLRFAISSACVGGGQGIALLIENPLAA